MKTYNERKIEAHLKMVEKIKGNLQVLTRELEADLRSEKNKDDIEE